MGKSVNIWASCGCFNIYGDVLLRCKVQIERFDGVLVSF